MPIGGGVGFKSPHGWGIEVLAETQKAKRNFDSDVRFDSTVTAARGPHHQVLRATDSTQPYAGGGLGVTTREVDARLTHRVHACQQRLHLHEPRHLSERHPQRARSADFAGVRIAAGNVLFVRPEFELSRAGEHMRIGGTVAVGASW